MALLIFPSNPNNGDLYPLTPLPGQQQYRWSAADNTWVLEGAATGVIPGCYGDDTTVPVICVDDQGRITSVTPTPISAVRPDLQQVTDEGAITTNTIDVAGLVAAGLTYPTSDGTGGDVLTTDGFGNLFFSTLLAPNLQAVTASGASTTLGISVGSIVASGLSYPTTDGAAGEVLATDGAGTLGWVAGATVVAAPSASTDPGNPNEVAYDSTYFYWYDGTNWQRVAADTTPW